MHKRVHTLVFIKIETKTFPLTMATGKYATKQMTPIQAQMCYTYIRRYMYSANWSFALQMKALRWQQPRAAVGPRAYTQYL